MKRFLTAVAFIVATVAPIVSTEALAADVGVSISVGQPGFYGRLDIGGYPPPQVIYRQPHSVWRTPANQPPIYMRVPPRHARHWKKHCGQYSACNERVFFVRDKWYHREYAPRYREQHGEHREDRDGGYRHNHGNHHGNGQRRGHGRNH